ncbi:hypothetical protein PBI_KAMPE_68 [Gordonia phage Kampe]|uniref:Uncharacterized protein n=3 Tax=Gordonia phage Orchid TaxID=1838075 RepID=A0A160DHE4_9CAUD|nr:hypothetical protein BH761_gp067 [Gordonia phage Orchid]ANA87302.1 hypothetical protein PBI_PATRICKSTAR_68 [Gordonia phage PatrickStar]ANA87414.1 hypothetical protein PBI_ORCHID_67 [Gordonia phage Orchid]ANA87529.1 hypothetical protein PBI_KAMPE_68 [Gordonia phage Kampe]
MNDKKNADVTDLIGALTNENDPLTASNQIHLTRMLIDFAINGDKAAKEYLNSISTVTVTDDIVDIKAIDDNINHGISWDSSSDTLWIEGCDCTEKVLLQSAVVMAAAIEAFIAQIYQKSALRKMEGKS